MSEERAGNESTGMGETVSIQEYAKLEREIQSLKEDYRQYQQAMSKKLDSLKEELRESGSSTENPKGSSGESEDESTDDDGILPIERLRQIREQDTEHPALPSNGRASFDRAVTIFENFGQWSDKAQAGRVIKSGLKNLLETALDERLYWSQVKRACAKLEEYSKGRIRLEKSNRHGNVLVCENQSVLAGTG